MNLLLIDAGHAKNTSGKVAPDKSMYEWEFNNDIQYKLKKRAEDHGIHVFLSNPTPSTTKDISLTNRANKMNNYWKSKGKPKALMVSLHANAHLSIFSSARGTETFIASNASENSKNAAKYILNEVVKTMKSIDKNSKDRGVKTSDFTVIYKTWTPCCLVEYGFYSNKEDLHILKNHRDDLVEATIKGICKYFNISYIPLRSTSNSIAIVYKGEVDKTISEVLSWGIKDSILVDYSKYDRNQFKRSYGVGGICNEINVDIELKGTDRWDTLKLVQSEINRS